MLHDLHSISIRHARACPGHPRLTFFAASKDDLKFPDHLDRFYHVAGAKNWYVTTEQLRESTAFRNATLQAAYFIVAARAIGLDCGPMSSFDNAKVDAEFFPDGQLKSNFLCNLGRGDPGKLPPVNERFGFEEVCKIL